MFQNRMKRSDPRNQLWMVASWKMCRKRSASCRATALVKACRGLALVDEGGPKRFRVAVDAVEGGHQQELEPERGRVRGRRDRRSSRQRMVGG
jgi:hypothetical protein